MHLGRGLWVPPAVAAALAVLVSFPTAAGASVGVGIQAAPVRLAGLAHPGQSYALPPVSVVNTGSHTELIRVAAQRVSGGPGRTVPPSWIRVSGPVIQLAPRHAASFPLELVVPSGATPGAYLSDIVASGSAAVWLGRANLGAAAATKLEFRVAPAAAAGIWSSAPWQTFWALLVLALLIAVVLGVRKSGLRIRVERKAVGYGAADQHGGWHA
jgi:hypothetical protein